ncbi:hypothetical protein R3W88_026902 [Solanum pinnatisectum]|uniref:Uncharacterized protein n=1 Tax=Solanum pinnatisectum TaxID=50273 RepID=A0AAV9LFT0_9SOLN|nr:hypothetical protein R3W88_026902 [Solanum pinnatisectum]
MGELIVRLLSRLDRVPTSGIRPDTTDYPITVGAKSPFQEPSVGFQTPYSSSVPSLAPPIFVALPFDSTSGEKDYDFLTECRDIFFYLGILVAHGVSYTSY